MADEKYYRFRVSIPKGAAQIIEWVKNQESPSYAIIHVLREWIAENGTDSVSNQAEHKPVRQDVDEDGFVDTDALFARQNRQRQSGVSIADMLNKR